MRDGVSKSAPMSASADAGRPGEDAGAEGDSRKQHQEEKKQNKKNISSGNDFALSSDRGWSGRASWVERSSVPRVFSRSPCLVNNKQGDPESFLLIAVSEQ